MTDEDGLRMEAATQFGFKSLDDTPNAFADWTHSATEAQIIAFAKACERAGLVQAKEIAAGELRNTSLLMSNPPQSSAAWDIRNAIDKKIEAIDADNTQILAAEKTPPPLVPAADELPDDLIQILAGSCVVEPCGSRVTCNPPPQNTDRDFLVVIPDDDKAVSEILTALSQADFVWEGSEHYQNAADGFMSHRRDDLNLIVTRNAGFAVRHRAATALCKRLNLPNKHDRVALFQAVLYGVTTGEPLCEDEGCPHHGTDHVCVEKSESVS